MEEEDNVEEEAKRLKHEADHEENMEAKCTKYLQVSIPGGVGWSEDLSSVGRTSCRNSEKLE